MKNFEISVSGKSLADILNAIDEAKNRIANGNTFGMDENEDGSFSFSADGEFDNE